MEEFNYENAAKFLDECKERPGKKTESTRQVIIRLAARIRELLENGYTQRQLYDMLVEKYALKVSFSAFRAYLNQSGKSARSTEDTCKP